MRQIFLDTETTGFEFKDGHRIIEFGAVEAINRKLTGNNLHLFFKPDIEVEQGAFEVHGISNERLKNEPLFEEKVTEIMEYLKGAELVIHNAQFDVPFINSELDRLSDNPFGKLEDHCTILDTLKMARKKHPGQRNSLDALCKRYHINNSHREFHGALLDSELLASVYFAMTGGQTALSFDEIQKKEVKINKANEKKLKPRKLKLIEISKESEKLHNEYLTVLEKKSAKMPLWMKLSSSDN